MTQKDLLRFSAIPIGIIMESVGKIINREDVINLGHYLSCKGTDRILNPKFYPEISKYFSGLDHLNPESFDKELFMAIGKFHCKKIAAGIMIDDSYEFYPDCGIVNHFSNCECKNKYWPGFRFGPIFISNKFWINFGKSFHTWAIF
jgi:hypothetical protein